MASMYASRAVVISINALENMPEEDPRRKNQHSYIDQYGDRKIHHHKHK